MKHRIVTISREFGSGGRSVGKQAAAQLNIPCYDQQLLEKIAAESGFTQEFVGERGEYAPHGSRLANAFSDRTAQGLSTQDYLWTIQYKLIRELAAQGPCVIVGRCADYILRDTADCLRVFIHADMDRRAERIVRLYGETEEAPLKRLRDKDKRRAAYYRFYTGMEWGDARHYHLSLDSGAFGIEQCAALIAQLYHALPSAGEVADKAVIQ